jgi:hypothetical protein
LHTRPECIASRSGGFDSNRRRGGARMAPPGRSDTVTHTCVDSIEADAALRTSQPLGADNRQRTVFMVVSMTRSRHIRPDRAGPAKLVWSCLRELTYVPREEPGGPRVVCMQRRHCRELRARRLFLHTTPRPAPQPSQARTWPCFWSRCRTNGPVFMITTILMIGHLPGVPSVLPSLRGGRH